MEAKEITLAAPERFYRLEDIAENAKAIGVTPVYEDDADTMVQRYGEVIAQLIDLRESTDALIRQMNTNFLLKHEDAQSWSTRA